MTQFREGIYLESKKGQLGTGHTASSVTFKNYYAVRASGDKLEMYLLDDDLGLTGLKESASPGSFSEKYQYQPQLQDRYEAILASLGPKPKAAAPQVRPEAKPPQSRPKPQPPQTKPQAAPPAAPPAGNGDANWWDNTRKGAENLLKKK